MEVGIDSFASAGSNDAGARISDTQSLSELLQRMKHADDCGLDVFGIGEHYRKEFLDSAPSMILAAAAAQTKRIKLTSAVTVLSTADPVRVFQNFATLDLISNGRAEMVVGRGSFTEAYPLFGFALQDYDDLFAEKLDLLLAIRDHEVVTWSGKFRAALHNQAIYPRPVQNPFPISLGVGGTPQSFVRAGVLGLPLTVAIIGGETHRFRPLIDLYKEAGIKSGHAESKLKVSLHSIGYVSDTTEKAIEEFFPGYAKVFTQIGRERGWPATTRASFNAQRSPKGALLVGNAEEVAEKILRHSEALGGIAGVTFQMDNALLTHAQLMHSIELIGTKVKPLIHQSN